MKRWIPVFAICVFCGQASASLIKYDITNFYTDLSSGVESVSPMEVVFDDDAQTLLSCILGFGSQTWTFSSHSGGIPVVRSANNVGGVYEIFALFDPLTLVNGGDEAVFSANEWKILDPDPNADVIANLGRSGPSGIGFLTVGGRNYGVTSNFDRSETFEVPEPNILVLASIGVFLLIIVGRRSQFHKA